MAGPCPLLSRRHSPVGMLQGDRDKGTALGASGANLLEIALLLVLLLMDQLVFSGMFRCLAPAGASAP